LFGSRQGYRRRAAINPSIARTALQPAIARFPNEASIIRLIGAVLLEQNDEWRLQHRYMRVESMAEIAAPPINADGGTVPTLAA
jgi:putative transposase